MKPSDAFNALGIPYDEEEPYASLSDGGMLFRPIPASYPNASFNPIPDPGPQVGPTSQDIGQNEFFDPTARQSRNPLDPTQPPAGAALWSQPGQVAQNAQNSFFGSPIPQPASVPLGAAHGPQGGAPSAPVDAAPAFSAPPNAAMAAHGPAPSNVGVANVPPPPTGTPIQEPGDYSAPMGPVSGMPGAIPPPHQPWGPVPGAEHLMNPATQPLADVYRPAFEQTLAARQRDLAAIQQGSGIAGMMYYDQLAGGHSPSPELATKMLMPYAGIELKTLKEAAESADLVAKAQLSNAAWDAKSPLAEASRISFLASPEADMMATRWAQDANLTPVEAKQKIYNLTKTMTPVAIEMMQKTLKASGDYSLQRATEAKNRAEEQASLASAAKLLAETENIPKTLGDANSIASQTAREFVRMMMPDRVKAIPNFDRLSAREIMGLFEGKFANTVFEVIKFRTDATREAFRQMDMGNPRYTVKVVSSSGTGLDATVPNVMPMSPQEKAEFRENTTQAKQALDYAAIITSILTKHNGVMSKVMLEARTGDGPLLKNAILMLARNATNIAPQHKGTLQPLIDKMNSSGDLRDLWDNGQLTTVMTIVNDIASNYRAKHSMVEDNYITPDSTFIPAWPPIVLPHMASIENGKLTYTFPNGIGAIREPVVYRNYNGQWIPDKRADGTPIQVRY